MYKQLPIETEDQMKARKAKDLRGAKAYQEPVSLDGGGVYIPDVVKELEPEYKKEVHPKVEHAEPKKNIVEKIFKKGKR